MSQSIDDTSLDMLRVACEFDDGEFCGRWLRERCLKEGVPFAGGKLAALCNRGLLEKLELSLGGNRRYFRVTDDGRRLAANTTSPVQ